ncbi:ABC transporter ATP-binding protein [Rhodococcus sp. NPDC019627]|uniref:ABC transporter ATP-binding protein n=1 Tax=unclassified Rhodococcus (in: high G+C Gram-positive bacteria) TaxID=192944 RepID=UPI0033CA229F
MNLRAEEISVAFRGIQALSKASISVEPGIVTTVVGPNGAGKSTLFNCLTGVVVPDSGSTFLGDREISKLPQFRRAQAGITRSFQTPRVDLESTVREAAALGAYAQWKPSLVGAVLRLPNVRRREAEVLSMTDQALDKVGLSRLANRRVGELSLAHVRLLEVARSLVGQPKFVLLDEPVAGLGLDDRSRLAETLRSLCVHGIGVLLIEHNLDFVARVSDSVSVLHRGSVIFSGSPGNFLDSDQVRAAFIGSKTPTGELSSK